MKLELNLPYRMAIEIDTLRFVITIGARYAMKRSPKIQLMFGRPDSNAQRINASSLVRLGFFMEYIWH